ncbi:MAG: 4Fe-4S dicluster domain-containing protein [Nitrospinae bacterium]|nr:4Fe-4S dicluster domain-containing protein [Nitrospinota bacterium]
MDKIDRKKKKKKGFTYIAEALASSVEDKITSVKRKRIRPPHAVNEVLFLSLCNSCDKCIEVCPHGAIRADASEDLIGGGKPVIVPRKSPCYMCEDMPCVKVCEPGALKKTDGEPLKMGRAMIIKERCHVWGGRDPFCNYCFERCPLKNDAIYMDNNPSFSKGGLVGLSGGGPVIRGDKCTGCGICEYICVADPPAIKVIPE